MNTGFVIISLGIIIGFFAPAADYIGETFCDVSDVRLYGMNGSRERVLVKRLSPTEYLFTAQHVAPRFEVEIDYKCGAIVSFTRVVGPVNSKIK